MIREFAVITGDECGCLYVLLKQGVFCWMEGVAPNVSCFALIKEGVVFSLFGEENETWVSLGLYCHVQWM